MKKVIVSLVLAFLIIPLLSFAQEKAEFNEEQQALRTDLFNFLKEEGFMPELDSDGDIKFKSEGGNYYINISKTNENPMYVVLYAPFNCPENYTMETVFQATKQLNFYKGVKVLCYEKTFRIGAELFLRDAEPLKDVFYKLKEIIEEVKSDVLDECKKVSSFSSSLQSMPDFPFLVTKLDIADVNEAEEVIQDYGSTIYSYKTKYLKPRITVKPFVDEGNYTIYVKLYKDGILRTGSSSPSGYSYSDKITIYSSSPQTFSLSSWGGKTAGHWKQGEYRFEIWYGDYCVGSKTFQIK